MRVLLNIVLLSLLMGCSSGNKSKQEFVGADISGAEMGSDVALTDHHGQLRKLTDFKGKVVVLFFGYTHCPDVCPTTLSDLAKALKTLGQNTTKVQVLFVTLDPERDTADVLAKYVPYFNASFLGVRADVKATEKLAKDFKIFYSRQNTESKTGYTLDHSAGLYVYGVDGRMRIYMNHGQSPQDIAHDLKILINE